MANQSIQIYYPNQLVTGTVQLVLSEPKWYQYVDVKLEGTGNVHWSETHGIGDNEWTEYYSESDTYMDDSAVVWGSREEPQPTQIDPGMHNFPFQFTIPSHCPPTFNMFSGEIKYRLLVTVSSQVKQYKIEAPLMVGYLVDLNLQPHLLEPVNKTAMKDITVCFCCNRGTAEINVTMPQTGFCVERDRIPVSFQCRNDSSQQITVRVEALQLIEFRTRTKSKSVSNKNFGGHFVYHIQATEHETKSLEFVIPTSVLPDFSTRIIKLSHIVSLLITTSYGCIPIYIPIPVVIGNVAFHNQAITVSPNTTVAGYPPPQGQSYIQTDHGSVPHSAVKGDQSISSNAELQSEAPPSYRAVISGEKF